MEIDIIDYTAEQYAVLTTKQLQEVREAQKKKDALNRACEKRLQKEQLRMMDEGSFLSNMWSKLETEIKAEYEVEISVLRESLLFFLHYSGNEYDTDAGGTKPTVSYSVDYSLSQEERMIAVRDYYLSAYSDATARFNAYQEDAFAKSYLGEGYASIWHYFQDLANA